MPVRRAALALALCLGVVSPAGATWVRVDTPNFVVYGESGERRVREVAAQFERFREALGRVIGAGVTRSAVPTVVVVFDTLRSFEPYRPKFNGKPIALSGYFRATEDQNLVALAIEDRQSALRIIFHKYTHLVVANVSRELPAWLNEGLAEYYSTFEVREDGREATMGRVIPSHLRLLNEDRLLPLDQLLAVDRSSPL